MPRAEAETMLAELEGQFSEKESAYLKKWLARVLFDTPQALGNNNGYYTSRNGGTVAASTAKINNRPLSEHIPHTKFTLMHELAHPLFQLAAQDGIGGFLIINPQKREAAQEKARQLYPEAIAKMDEALAQVPMGDLVTSSFSPEEQIAMMTYMYLDERRYDRVGGANTAHILGGYDRPTRNHEIACNLKALKACEHHILGAGHESIVMDIAGDIMRELDKFVEKSLTKNPQRSPVAAKVGTAQGAAGSG